MKRAFLAYGLSFAIVSSLTLIPVSSFAKTLKACAEEWKANKTTIQASGKKKTAFIIECRAEAASAEPAKAPEAQPAPAGQQQAAAAETKGKTARACAAEWTSNKAALQASGKTRRDFIAGCRAGASSTAAAAPSEPAKPEQKPVVAAAPQQQAPAEQPKPEIAAAPAPKAAAPKAPAGALAAGQFASESEAKSHCPGDTVVWANTRSKVYHYASSRIYGHTKRGAYMCEKETASAGIRAAKRERRL